MERQQPEQQPQIQEDNSPPPNVVPFSSPRRSKDEPIDRPKRKEINLGELKKAIEDSLDKKADKGGTIEPGQTVQF